MFYLLSFFFLKANFPLWKWHVFIFRNPATGIYNFWGREAAQETSADPPVLEADLGFFSPGFLPPRPLSLPCSRAGILLMDEKENDKED